MAKFERMRIDIDGFTLGEISKQVLALLDRYGSDAMAYRRQMEDPYTDGIVEIVAKTEEID